MLKNILSFMKKEIVLTISCILALASCFIIKPDAQYLTYVDTHTILILSSQVISNVPAALLLSGFTNEWSSLIVGTNLGGLGTLIASMASLISYKQVAQHYPEQKGKYMGIFTILNITFLIILFGTTFII